MKQSLFESRHKTEWEQFALMLERLERGKEPRESPASPATIDGSANTWPWLRSVVTAAFWSTRYSNKCCAGINSFIGIAVG